MEMLLPSCMSWLPLYHGIRYEEDANAMQNQLPNIATFGAVHGIALCMMARHTAALISRSHRLLAMQPVVTFG